MVKRRFASVFSASVDCLTGLASCSDHLGSRREDDSPVDVGTPDDSPSLIFS